MAFGQDNPSGLVAVNSYTSAPYNAQTRPFNIAPGYAFNIFRGDLVYLSGGYIHSLFELGAGTYETRQSMGVFNGCSYIQPTAANPADPASPARPFWPSGTQTVNNSPVTGYVIADPLVCFTIQSDATGVAFEDIGKTAYVTFTAGPPNPIGDTTTGNSKMVLRGSSINTDPQNANLKLVGFDATPGNPIPLPGAGKSPFVNVLVLIQNHSLMQRAPGI
jgi:hypothetical protein